VAAIRYQSPDPGLVLPFTCRGDGFPVIRAEVSLDGAGYRAVVGWLQVISRSVAASGELVAEVDLPPVLAAVTGFRWATGSQPRSRRRCRSRRSGRSAGRPTGRC
jgi:hypothetical protein